MCKDFWIIENEAYDDSLTEEECELALRYHFGVGNMSRFEEERGRRADEKLIRHMQEFSNMKLE